MKRKLHVIIACILLVLFLTAAVKTKKASVSKSSREITELKERLAIIEAQKVSLTAKVETLEKDIKKLKNSTKMYMMLSIAGGSAALVLVIMLITGAMAKNSGADTPSGSSKTPPGREKHYEDIEYHVLNDWQNIWFHPENIDMKLYDDLKNHYAELHSDIEQWKHSMLQRQELSADLGKALSGTYPVVETLESVYMLAYEEPDLFIEKNEIKSGPYVCARIKADSQGTREMMTQYCDDCIKMFEKRPYSDIKSLNGDVIGLKNEIDLKIRKIKFTKQLPGDCSYTEGK